MGNTLGHTQMNQGLDAAVAAVLREVPRSPAIEQSQSGPRVVHQVVHGGVAAKQIAIQQLRAQSGVLRMRQHPVEGDQRHSLFGIPATDVRVDAGEPDLIDPRIGAAPQYRHEREARIVDGKRVAGALDVPAEVVGAKLELIDQTIRGVGNGERHADGIDRVPHADELDRHIAVYAVRVLCVKNLLSATSGGGHRRTAPMAVDITLRYFAR